MPDQSVVLEIRGMSCGHCVKQVQQTLEKLDGVTVRRVVVGEALVDIDSNRRSPGDLIQAIDQVGYQAVVR